MRRVLSLFLGQWPTDRLRRRGDAVPGGAIQAHAIPGPEVPLVTVAGLAGRQVLVAVDRAAAAAGLTPGLGLADARARLPGGGLVAMPADPAGDAAALLALAHWCGRYSPWVALDGADGLWLDITGAVPLFASEAALARDLADRLAAAGIAARLAVAETPGAAWALARYGQNPVRILPAGAVTAALAPLPVEALRLPAVISQDLHRLGLDRIGQLYPLPRAPLAPRFGEEVARRLDQALGRRQEPISPLKPIVPLEERLLFAEPIATAEAIALSSRRLIERLCQRLDRIGQGARRLVLTSYRADGGLQVIPIGTSRPSRDPAHLSRLFADRLGEIAPGLGIDGMSLAIPLAEPLAPAQARLDRDHRADPVAPLIDRLAGHHGADRVLRLEPRQSHVPERAQILVPALTATRPNPPPAGAIITDPGAWRIAGPRPIRLLDRPDRVEVMAPVPDDPPLLFRWRRVTHRIRHAEGPERIAAEWWRVPERDPAAAGRAIRDYYRVEDEAGGRFWLYRAGLYRPDPAPRWYLHGFFA